MSVGFCLQKYRTHLSSAQESRVSDLMARALGIYAVNVSTIFIYPQGLVKHKFLRVQKNYLTLLR